VSGHRTIKVVQFVGVTGEEIHLSLSEGHGSSLLIGVCGPEIGGGGLNGVGFEAALGMGLIHDASKLREGILSHVIPSLSVSEVRERTSLQFLQPSLHLLPRSPRARRLRVLRQRCHPLFLPTLHTQALPDCYIEGIHPYVVIVADPPRVREFGGVVTLTVAILSEPDVVEFAFFRSQHSFLPVAFPIS
jgi:hypothetical protein